MNKNFNFKLLLFLYIQLALLASIPFKIINLQGLIGFAVALASVFLVHKFNNKIKIDNKKLSILVAFIVLLPIISLLVFNPSRYDDVLILHEYAIRDIKNGTIDYNDPYSIRNLFYLLPIYKYLGCNYNIVKIFNLLSYFGIVILLFKIFKIYFDNNKNKIFIALLIFFSIPYWCLSVTIGHYDLVGTFYMLISIFLLNKILLVGFDNGSFKCFSYSIIYGFSLIPFFYTRGTFSVFIIVTFIFSIIFFFQKKYSAINKLRFILSILLIPFTIYFTFSYVLKQQKFVDNSNEFWNTSQAIFSYNDTRDDGTSGHKEKKWDYFPELPDAYRTKYAILKLNSEIYYNWHWYVFHLFSKNNELLNIGGLNVFILHDSSFREVLAIILNIFEVLLRFLIIVFSFFGLISYIRSIKEINIFIIFLSSLIFVCLFFALISEARSRYSLLFLFPLVIFTVDGIIYVRTKDNINMILIQSCFKKLTLLLCLLIVFFLGYRQVFALNYKFIQVSENRFTKDFGKRNLSAFQYNISEEKPFVLISRSSNNVKRLSFFVRCSTKNTNKFTMNLYDKSNKNIKINEISNTKFKSLYHHSEVSIKYFEFDLADNLNDIVIDFTGSLLDENLIIEYVYMF